MNKKNLDNVQLIRLGPNDVEHILDLLINHYFIETTFAEHLTVDWAQAREYVMSWFSDPSVFVLGVVEKDEGLIGLSVFTRMRTYYVQEELDTIMFVVRPDYRGSKVARQMVEFSDFLAKELKVGVVYSVSAGGIGETNDSKWVNLFSKSKFVKLGTTMAKFY